MWTGPVRLCVGGAVVGVLTQVVRNRGAAACRSKTEAGAAVEVAVILASGSEVAAWRGAARPVRASSARGLLSWYRDYLATERPHAHRGFDVARALREAQRLARGALPVVVVCGALVLAMPGGAPGATSGAVLDEARSAQQASAIKHERCAPAARLTWRMALRPC